MKKFALLMVVPAAGAMLIAGAGEAQAADLYGAIAISGFRVGVATDFPTQYQADAAALESCADPRCWIQARIHNECGVVMETDIRGPFTSQPMYHAGKGPTRAAAEQDARKIADLNVSIPFHTVSPAFVLDAACTSNAG